MTQRLRITEIFYSLQGETRTVGLPTVFVRLTGCPLRCQYCDTAYAFTGGQYHTITDILQQVAHYQPKYVTVTGGEPLAQPDCLPLLAQLCDAGYEVSLETSGHLDLKDVDARVVKVMDIKTPGSLEVKRNKWDNLQSLLPHDQIKFVICDRGDYDWAKGILAEHKLSALCEVLFSPSYGEQAYGQLADWILEDRLDVRLQIQLHKVLWGDQPGK
ncbi:MAG: 7-carboxy-7-deazaguanine synthase QueE [Pseudomonadota bacterium]|nr:7-carboxy-7-deazaguanine synthase QueE [Pseudomonadota bacterium]